MARAKTTDETNTADKTAHKGVVSASVSPELYEAVEEYRWANRMSKGGVVAEALTEWAQNRGLLNIE